MKFSGTELQTIKAALWTAAKEYERCAKDVMNYRLSRQFERQASAAQFLYSAIEESGE